ncbi:RNA 2',3'-cyclic phosphodiesterase [archaeon]|nr:RNA 2',3'-cyclic phosphodiesterase [archaeon]
MRTFIAIDLPKEVKDYLFKLPKKIKGAKVKWTSKKNLHITMQFLGELPEETVDKIKEVIKTIKFKPFKVKLSQIGFFPNEKAPKIIWLGVEPREEVYQLAQTIDAELLAFTKEQRFETHITLGRMKGIKKKDDFYKSIKELEIESIEFEINSFTLYKSVLKREGPQYYPIENVEMS